MTEYICETEKWGDTFDEPVIRWNEPIVRCRDCRFVFEQGGHEYCFHNHDDSGEAYLINPDGFCSWGEPND